MGGAGIGVSFKNGTPPFFDLLRPLGRLTIRLPELPACHPVGRVAALLVGQSPILPCLEPLILTRRARQALRAWLGMALGQLTMQPLGRTHKESRSEDGFGGRLAISTQKGSNWFNTCSQKTGATSRCEAKP